MLEIVGFAPLAVLAFVLIPLPPQMILASANGQLAAVPGLFAGFVEAPALMSLAMATGRPSSR